jgi:hypothetical protein
MSDWQKEWKVHNLWRTYKSIWDEWDGYFYEYLGEDEEEEDLWDGVDEERDYMGRRKNTRWDRRDKKRHKAQHGMRESGRSVKFIEQIMNSKLRKAGVLGEELDHEKGS